MYGLVNKAIRSMILHDHGHAAWTKIRTNAGLEIDDFLAMEPYDDAVSYGLVGAASEHLQQPADRFLFDLGVHWIHFSGRSGYGNLMEGGGAHSLSSWPTSIISTPRSALSFLRSAHRRSV